MSNTLARYIASVFVICMIAVWWFEAGQYQSSALSMSAIQPEVLGEQVETVEEPKVFPEVELTAKSAVVYDVSKNEIIYSKKPNAQLPLASITKLMTAYTALEIVEEDFPIEIKEGVLNAIEGDSGLYANDVWTLAELAKFSLVNSSNDGAQSIANEVGEYVGRDFIELMNEQASILGFNQTYFVNPTGLDNSESQPSVFGSAIDAAKLIAVVSDKYPEIIRPTTYDEYQASSVSGIEYVATNTNAWSSSTPGLMASKTGYTELAGGNLAVLVEISPERPIAIAVLGASRETRFSDVMKLVEATITFMGQ